MVLRFGPEDLGAGAGIGADAVLELELAAVLPSPVESMPPETGPVGTVSDAAEVAAEVNFWRVWSDPLGLDAE